MMQPDIISRNDLLSKAVVLCLVLIIATVLIGGRWYYVDKTKRIRMEVENNLTAIVRLKVSQIAAWRIEKLLDASVLVEDEDFTQMAAHFLVSKDDEDANKIRVRLDIMRNNYQYDDIILVDAAGTIRLDITGKFSSEHPEIQSCLAQSFREYKPAISNLYKPSPKASPRLLVVAPFFSGKGESRKPLGAIMIVHNANTFLYPLVKSWPVSSRTAETLVVRRDGADVLFLNDLRNLKNAALNHRIPLNRTDVPAVMAVLGKEGVMVGTDYRGVEVISILQSIPNSPWFMVAKVDAVEALASMERESILILIMVIGLVVLAGAVGLTTWQYYQKRVFRKLYRAEAQHGVILNSIGDGVIVSDIQGRVKKIKNPMAEKLTGWTLAEAVDRPLGEIFHLLNEITRKAVDDPVTKVLQRGAAVNLESHSLLIAKDGTEIPIVDSGSPITDELGEITGVVLIFRDHSAERLSEKMIKIRLGIVEYSATHSLDELLTYSLDKISAMVTSPIAFFHFVESDQKTLTLQQWSTRTVEEFCRAEGRGLHYGIDQAGVWVDCVRVKKPVIHNDYQKLSNKKGLPPGHAPIIRELVVPVIREDKVVGILGVGNKSRDYTESDVEIISYLADVTWVIVKHKLAEESLIHQSSMLVRTEKIAQIGSWEFDTLTGKMIWSEEMYRIFNLPPFSEPPSFAEHRQYFLPDDFSRLERAVAAALQEGTAYKLHLQLVRSDGARRHTFVRGAAEKGPDGVAVRLAGSLQDITERKKAEAERERLLTAIEHTDEIIYITDPIGTLEYVNPAFERVTGYTRQEVIGQNPRMFKSGQHDEKFYRAMDSTIRSGRTWRGRIVNKRKNGSLYTEDATISPVLDGSGSIVNFVAIKRDITERLETEAQLIQAQKMESVGRLAGGVAHDYNNMLSVIIGYSELALAKVDASEPLHDYLKEIYAAAVRSADITRQLLAFARKQTIAPVVIDLNQAVENMLKMLHRLIGEDIDLSWSPVADLWPVKIDQSQLDQILANLCVNARDAINGVGRVTIETGTVTFDEDYCASHRGFIPGEYVLLAVSDDGCGMEREIVDKIFEPFFTTKAVGQGTGLGLSMVYGIVKQNQGFINVYSEPGKGTTFKIYLARHTSLAVEIPSKNSEDISIGHGEVVLVVEDEISILNFARRLLEDLEYTVLTANSPSQALNLVEEHQGRIDLLITDVIMPEMNGRELSSRLHNICPGLKTLFMSGYTANAIAHHGVLDVGINFIQKPFSKKVMAIKIREALNN